MYLGIETVLAILVMNIRHLTHLQTHTHQDQEMGHYHPQVVTGSQDHWDQWKM